MAYWHTARYDPRTDGSRSDLGGSHDLGWVGRALNKRAPVQDKAPASVFVGLEFPPLAVGRVSAAASFNGLDDLTCPRQWTRRLSEAVAVMTVTFDAFVRRSLVDAYSMATALDLTSRGAGRDVAYPRAAWPGSSSWWPG